MQFHLLFTFQIRYNSFRSKVVAAKVREGCQIESEVLPMFLLAAVLVLSLISFGVTAVITAKPDERSKVALLLVEQIASLLNPFVSCHVVRSRGHPKKCKEKPANRNFDRRD